VVHAFPLHRHETAYRLIRIGLWKGLGVRGLAPGWIIECPRCRKWKHAGDAGIVRLRAASRAHRTLTYRSRCRRLVFARLYKDRRALGAT